VRKGGHENQSFRGGGGIMLRGVKNDGNYQCVSKAREDFPRRAIPCRIKKKLDIEGRQKEKKDPFEGRP